MKIEKTISNLIQSQFPEFYLTDGPMLITFVQAYYEWLELPGNPLYDERRLLEYSSIDTTIDQFISHFNSTYMSEIQYTNAFEKRLAIKRILDLYRAKGTQAAVKLLFQLVFGDDIDIYLPSTDILKSSDGKWTVPVYLEVNDAPGLLNLNGKIITGLKSGATAFVERVVTRKSNGKFFNIYFLNNLNGNFITGEVVFPVDNSVSFAICPTVIGSLTELIVDNGGFGFKVGDLVDLQSAYGIEGIGRVVAIEQVSGTVKFTLVDGGWGYSNTYSEVIISDTVLFLNNLQNIGGIPESIQRFTNLAITSDNTALPPVYCNVFAVGNTANLFVKNISSSLIVGDSISTYANLVITSVQSNTFNTLQLAANVPAPGFIFGEPIYQTNGTANTASGILLASNSTTLVVDTSNGSFVTTQNVYGLFSLATSAVSLISNSVFSYVGVANTEMLEFFPSSVYFSGTQSAANAEFLYAQIELGVKVGNTPLTNSYNLISVSNTSANIFSGSLTGFSSGINANVKIGMITPTEEIVYWTDFTGANNSFGIPYMSLSLQANSYGFPKNPLANVNIGYLKDILNFQLLELGSIDSIVTTNPGINYNHFPYVAVYEPAIASRNLQDYIAIPETINHNFIIGETVTQSVPLTNTLTFNLNQNVSFNPTEIVVDVGPEITGTFQTAIGSTTVTGPTASLVASETILLGNTDVRTISTITNSTSFTINSPSFSSNSAATVYPVYAKGIVVSQPSGNTLYIQNVGSTAWSSNIYGTYSSSIATINSIVDGAYSIAVGQIKQGTAANTIYIRRESIESFVTSGNPIIGQFSGVSSNVVIYTDSSTNYAGNNAVITSNTFTSNGTVANLAIQSSGVGYINGELINFVSQANSQLTGTALTYLGRQGYGQGYYQGSDGFLSDTKYIQDGFFYQLFSYQIKSSLDQSIYYQVVKDVVHTVGSALYSGVVKKTVANLPLTSVSSPIQLS